MISKERPKITNTAFILLSLETVKYITSKNTSDLEKITQIEETGSHIGERIANCLMDRNKTKSRMEIDEIMKFLAGEVWKEIFGRQVTRLQTNWKGTYLFDVDEINLHMPLINSKMPSLEEKCTSDFLLTLVCGIIKGVLGVFNVSCLVNASFVPGPQVSNILGQSVGKQCSYTFTINLLNIGKELKNGTGLSTNTITNLRSSTVVNPNI